MDRHNAPGDARPALLSSPDLLPGIVQGALDRHGADGWEVRRGGFWCHVRPPDHRPREQGWKLHLSATPLSAALVLTLASEVLLAERASFKFAGTVDRVAELTGARTDRGGGGKFLTVYPDDDTRFRRLAARLHEVTDGMRGPGILSDRQYRPGSLVHYRFGAFHGVRTLTHDGTVEVMLRRPDGTLERDERRAWVTTPSWAPAPFPESAGEPPAGGGGRDAAPGDGAEAAPAPAKAPVRATAVRLAGRYLVRKALRHAYKGGVYLGRDETTGRDVVIKEARPHVAGRVDGTDQRDALRHEEAMLQALEGLDVGPRALASFTQGPNHFLVQEHVPGTSLRAWVAAHPGRGMAEFLGIAGQLVTAVRKIHALGYVLRDLNPNNLMVLPDLRVRVIDLELLAPAGEAARRAYTPGYGAPEVAGAAPGALTVPEHRADLYSLGAVLLHLVAGVDLVAAPDTPVPRPPDERTAPLAGLALADHPWAAPLLPLLLALTAADPADRWSLDRVEDFLTGLGRRTAGPPPDGAGPAQEPPELPFADADRDRLIADGLTHLLTTRSTGRDGHLWPLEGFAATNDPLNVQHGAAGVLAVLTRAAASARPHPGVRDAAAEVAQWVRDRLSPSGGGLPEGSPLLPGLYFGRSGTAWALLDAGRFLGDDAAQRSALDLARRVPVEWPNRDVCHGAAGAGLAQLHCWRVTGETEFRQRVVACAEGVLAAAEEHPAGLIWPVPATFASHLAGARQFGFAHGVAGIGAFLLAAGLATDREDFTGAAERAGETLLRVAHVEGGRAHWPAGDRAADGPQRAVHWCNGASGVGTFLVRLWRATGQERFREGAELGAAAVRRSVWQSPPVVCHGLAGDAEFLLDLAAACDEPRYRRWARDLAACVHARNVLRDGLLVVPDETMGTVSACYQTGLAGVVSLLLRLREGGPRLWLPEGDLRASSPSTALLADTV
ncbi:class IV lanthionine synthetase LanL [Streptomyces sp. JJ36]|uniref:class IV lanthionine synthetase LanL n=1 Tax=Streptomyces sp. JJ36 TaxID=2736645 RepID=UPI001F3C9802|nr:class IV lanthionine synthetase LanL [Streptomyces sp. JJ36]MCF6524639.1 class IV lanthionine synthetase LanL [Streptomyces sp. JJ36]